MITPRAIEDYIASHATEEDSLLYELNRQSHLQVPSPNCLSGHVQGVFLSLISQMIKPKHILEIGTYTAYSTICLAKGLEDEGIITSIDCNEEVLSFAKKYVEQSLYKDKIKLILGEARDVIPSLEQSFDLVFIDADKTSYSLYYDLIWDKVNIGGYILVDNVLWYGKVLDNTAKDEQNKQDKQTRAIQDFNEKLKADNRVEKVIIPMRDGIMMIRKNDSPSSLIL